MGQEKSCESRVWEELQKELYVFRAYADNPDIMEDGNKELPPFYEYGLCVDYVEPGTFNDQPEGYVRYQISWGGPSDEFRYYVNPDGSVHRIEYWFLDWFDGAHITLKGEEYDIMDNVFEWLTGGDISHLIAEE